jgi:hypothetical protein
VHNSLDELAKRMGIEPKFRNVRGETVRARAETKRSLLAAMGFEAADESAAYAALSSLDRTEWPRALPLVPVLREGGEIDMTLPTHTAEVAWQTALENGVEHSGWLCFRELPLLAEHWFGSFPLQRRSWTLPEGLPGVITG